MDRYRRPSAMPRVLAIAALGLIAGLALALSFGLPRIVGVMPEGGGASSRSPITITFSHTMDRASVESRLQIEPRIAGEFSGSGNVVRFTPQTEWPSGTMRVALTSGAKTDRGLPLLFQRAWEFTISGPRVAFLLKTNDVANVWAVPLTGGGPAQITKEAIGVREFAVSADGTQIVYSALRADGGADLRRVDREGNNADDVLLCPDALCAAPAFSPDGKLLAFERYPISSGGQERPRVEVLDFATGQTLNPAPDATHFTRLPSFAPDGRLGYLDATVQAIAVYDFAAQFTTLIPDSSGDMGTWSPDSLYIVYPEIVFPPEPTPDPDSASQPEHTDRFFSHLQRVTVATNAAQNLSGDALVEDGSPMYSPDGGWIAFGRKALAQDLWTPGRQLWLMRADGSDAHPLTDDSFYNHSAFVWSPDGASIVFMRFDVTDPSSPPEVWMIDKDGTNARKLVSAGYLPEWLP